MLPLAFPKADPPNLIRLHGEPYTFVKHTPGMSLTLDLRLTRFLQRLALRRSRLLISPSYHHAHEIRAELGMRALPVEVVPNVIAEELLRSGESATDVAGSLTGPIVLFVGRLERRKGVLLLLEAAGKILAETPDVHLVLAGGRHASVAEKDVDDLLRQPARYEARPPARPCLLGKAARLVSESGVVCLALLL